MTSVSQAAGGVDLKRAKRVRQAGAAPLDRVPPHSDEAEQGVLGCLLLSPNESFNQCQKIFRGDEFYDLRHEAIYAALVEMREKREAVDLITLQQRLKDRQLLDQVGGIPYLNQLQDSVPSAANLSYYADIVAEKAAMRRMIEAGTRLAAKAYGYEGKADALLDEFEREAMSVRRNRADAANIGAVVDASLTALEDKFARSGAIRGLSTGFPDLDHVLDGLCPGDLIVPAAFPSGGKTSLCLNFVEHVALNLSEPVAIFSLEMTAEQLATRIISSRAKVNVREIHQMNEADFARVGAAAQALRKSGVFIMDTLDTCSAIVAESRRLKQEHGVKLVVVDYLQLVVGDKGGRDENREQEVSGVASALKRLAKELKVPVVVPSQLNDDGKLRESRAIGQHCDVELLLKSAAKKAKGRDDDEIAGDFADAEPVNVFVAKNRNGRRGVTVPLTFLKIYTRFESAAKVSGEDVPGM